jgi:hypothetical protein
MIVRHLSLVLVLCLVCVRFAVAQAPQPIPLEAAHKDFLEAKALCDADGGKLWGISLCGPMMFVGPESRSIVANQPDAQGALTLHSGVYIGLLPKSENMGNTATEWNGTHWTEMLWSLPEDRSKRDTLMMHELFHRIQDQLKLPTGPNVENAHLDTLEGRYTLQLEYRALTRALDANTDDERRAATTDALLFRAERYRLFPQAAAEEKTLERNEGLAEYTGVRVGNAQPVEAKTAALNDLDRQAKVPTFVRSFAYATGPAYGLLLDRYQPDWRTGLQSGEGLNEILQAALKITLPPDLEQTTQQRAVQYDGVALRAAETEREARRKATLALYHAQFVDGPTLTLPLKKMSVQFDPRTLQPMDNLGTVYPTIRVTDLWGILEVSKGALLKRNWTAVVVVAPTDTTGNSIKGDGWTLQINSGWKLVPAPQKGNYLLQPAP